MIWIKSRDITNFFTFMFQSCNNITIFQRMYATADKLSSRITKKLFFMLLELKEQLSSHIINFGAKDLRPHSFANDQGLLRKLITGFPLTVILFPDNDGH